MSSMRLPQLFWEAPALSVAPDRFGVTLVGALIIAVLTNGLVLTGVSDIWQYIIKGLVIIGAVALDRYRLAKTARS
jgi:predicted ABC-type sugar transport system permease subunit